MKNTASTIKRFTKVKLGAAGLKLAAIALLTVMLGLSFAACDSETPANTPQAPKAESVTIGVPTDFTDIDPEDTTGKTLLLGAGAGIDFSSKVLPEGASPVVIWSAEPTGKADITLSGKLTLTAAAQVGDTITVTAMAKDVDTAFDKVKIKVNKEADAPETITVSSSSQTVAVGGTVQFSVTVTPLYASRAVTWSVVDGSGTINQTGVLTAADNAVTGTNIKVKAASTKNSTFGEATVSVIAKPAPATGTIIISGMPTGEGEMGILLVKPGTGQYGESRGYALSSTETFTVTDMQPGVSDIFLISSDPLKGGAKRIAENQTINTGVNTIPFGNFAVIQPNITVAVTGIPSTYINEDALLELYLPGAEDGDFKDRTAVRVTGERATFSFYRINPGTYDIVLFIGEDKYTFANQNLGATNERELSKFTPIPVKIKVTVTGLSKDDHEARLNISLASAEPEDIGYEERTWQRNGNAVFLFYNDEVEPNKSYDLDLTVEQYENGYTRTDYYLNNQNLTADTTIPLKDFQTW